MISESELHEMVQALRPGLTPDNLTKLLDAAVEDRVWNMLAEAGLWKHKSELQWGDTEDAIKVGEWIQATAASRLATAIIKIGVQTGGG